MPATFDMSLAAMREYQGRNPRPEDFDDFWDAGLREMRALDPEIELIPADFQVPFARCLDLYFTGVGGARIHAKLVRPLDLSQSRPAVVLFHSYAESSGDWVDKLTYASLGYTVAALDVRGQGGQSQDITPRTGNTLRGHIVRGLADSPNRLFYREVYLDTAQLAGIVMAMEGVDENRVAAIGMSQGGGLALACAALEPRIRQAVSMAPFLSDYRRVWEMDLARDGYAQLQEYFRRFDPLHERQDETFLGLGYIDVQHLCSRIRADVLMTVGLMDTVCPPSTQFAAYNKIRSEKSMLLYPDFGHEIPIGARDRIFQFIRRLSDTSDIQSSAVQDAE